MATVTLTQKQKDALKAAGIDWQKLLQALAQYGPIIVQAILAIIGVLTPTPPTPAHEGLAAACPCPDPQDGLACCHACQRHILLAALCCEEHCGGQCDTKKCCCETLHHLLKAVECCACHCNC